MGVQILQDILVVLFAGYVCIDNAGIAVFNAWAVIMGMVTGIIMGDMATVS